LGWRHVALTLFTRRKQYSYQFTYLQNQQRQKRRLPVNHGSLPKLKVSLVKLKDSRPNEHHSKRNVEDEWLRVIGLALNLKD
jgi:hypothetical protein